MSESFAPPPGPPPSLTPQVPDGYKAEWSEKYNAWFYVNLHNKKSQWEKPTQPAHPDRESTPPGPPPGYSSNNREFADTKQNFNSKTDAAKDESDAELAARLQLEEEKRARGETDVESRYVQPPLSSQEQKPKRGFLGKLLGKVNTDPNNNNQTSVPPPQYGLPQEPKSGGYPGNSQQSYPSQGNFPQGFNPNLSQGYPPQGYPPQGYPAQGYPPQGYPPQGYPPQSYPPQGYPPQGYPPQGYPPQGYPPQGYPPQGYPPQGYAQQQSYGDKYPPPVNNKTKKAGGGLGMAGGAALGLGAGLVGGMLLEDAIESHDERIYEQGYQDAQEDDDFGDDDDF